MEPSEGRELFPRRGLRPTWEAGRLDLRFVVTGRLRRVALVTDRNWDLPRFWIAGSHQSDHGNLHDRPTIGATTSARKR